jgi:hypothetical protein
MTKADHYRVLDLLKSKPSQYFATYEIAATCNIMDNTVHRALDTLENKMGIQIDHKPFVTPNGARVMSYRYAAKTEAEPVKASTLFVGSVCKCERSFYVKADTMCCNRCGVNREVEYRAWAEKNKLIGGR